MFGIQPALPSQLVKLLESITILNIKNSKSKKVG